ncbi:Pol polyprotein [Thelohanellus kitauei]|uniref:Pol polyprotein n=1 Tax=Thelohanellus kitauei TaxID=669202 RepID=A0A0C2IY35_THEKT|nr:Pol polyprotein [Thelohanellus kitauei]
MHINIDLVGPLSTSKGFSHLLTIVDRFTRWPETIPIGDTSSSECSWVIISHWIARFGVPMPITTDREPQFTSDLSNQLDKILGYHVHRTTAYHPQTNGLVERFHRHLNTTLYSRLVGPSLVEEISWLLLGIRTTSKEDLKASSTELLYGSAISVNQQEISPQILLDQLRTKVKNLYPMSPCYHGNTPKLYLSKDIYLSRFVFVRRDAYIKALTPPYNGPYLVLVYRPKSFKIQIGEKTETVSIDRLKVAHINEDNRDPMHKPRHRTLSHNVTLLVISKQNDTCLLPKFVNGNVGAEDGSVATGHAHLRYTAD